MYHRPVRSEFVTCSLELQRVKSSKGKRRVCVRVHIKEAFEDWHQLAVYGAFGLKFHLSCPEKIQEGEYNISFEIDSLTIDPEAFLATYTDRLEFEFYVHGWFNRRI